MRVGELNRRSGRHLGEVGGGNRSARNGCFVSLRSPLYAYCFLEVGGVLGRMTLNGHAALRTVGCGGAVVAGSCCLASSVGGPFQHLEY